MTAEELSFVVIEDVDFPSIEFYFRLSIKQVTYERQVYSIFTALGDLGGFNSAIMGLPAFFMSIYSECMFNQSLREEIPVRKNKSRR